MTEIHIIFTDSDVILSNKNYSCWQDIQSSYSSYKASLGPWSAELVIDWLENEYDNLQPKVEEQIQSWKLSEEDDYKLLFK